MPQTFSRFLLWCQNVTPPYPEHLAWCHTTDAYALRDMINKQQISPCHCAVFDDDLSYFFYGRPAFRKNDPPSSGQNAISPVVIMLNPSLILQGARLHPFDTGAFATKRYVKWMHHKMDISDFELECEINASPRHVSAFFDTNQNYLDLKCRNPTIPYNGEYEVESIIELLSDKSGDNADDRRLAMELQVSKLIPFNASSVWGLIIAEVVREAPWFKNFMAGPGYGIDLIDYKFFPQRQAIQYQTALEDAAREMQNKKSLI